VIIVVECLEFSLWLVAFPLEFGVALPFGLEIVFDRLEFRPRRLEVGERRFDLRFPVAARLDIEIERLEFVLEVGDFLGRRFDLVLEFPFLRLEPWEFGIELFEALEAIIEVAFLGLEGGNVGFDLVRIDRTHDEFTKLVAASHCSARFVGFEQEGKEVREFRILEIGITVEDHFTVASLEVSLVPFTVEFQFGATGVRIAFQRGAPTAQRGHNRLEERRSIRRVPSSQDVNAGFKRNLATIDTADILRENGNRRGD